MIEAARQHVQNWPSTPSAVRREFLQAAVQRVAVKERALEITLNRAALGSLLAPVCAAAWRAADEDGSDTATIELTVEARLARCGLEVRLMIAGDEQKNKPTRISQSLIKAIARGRNWYEELVSKEKVTLTDLAAQSGMNDRYASRILRSAFLAPDIVEAILDGRQPVGLTLNKALDDLPLDWVKQRQLLGF